MALRRKKSHLPPSLSRSQVEKTKDRLAKEKVRARLDAMENQLRLFEITKGKRVGGLNGG